MVASIGVWGQEKNILGPRQAELANLATAAARDISQSLGYLESADARAKSRDEKALEPA
ncbi:hypothetical protein D3C83_240620 [compost metagenome]